MQRGSIAKWSRVALVDLELEEEKISPRSNLRSVWLSPDTLVTRKLSITPLWLHNTLTKLQHHIHSTPSIHLSIPHLAYIPNIHHQNIFNVIIHVYQIDVIPNCIFLNFVSLIWCHLMLSIENGKKLRFQMGHLKWLQCILAYIVTECNYFF